MTTNPTIRIHNVETNEVIDRQMTDAEFEKYTADKAEYAAEKLQKEQRAADKAALLVKLGITADEAKLLLG